MDKNSLRLLIRNILLESVPDYKRKEFYDILGKGLRAGKGEVPSVSKKGKENIANSYKDNEWRKFFKNEFVNIKDDDSSDPNRLRNSTKTSAMLNKMDRFMDGKIPWENMFEWNKKYSHQVIKDYQSIRNHSLKNAVSDCFDAFYNFLSDVNQDYAYDFQWIGRKDVP